MIGISKIVTEKINTIKRQLPERAMQVAIELKNTELEVNSGSRSGRVYGNHIASAPGESPASMSGTFKNSFTPLVRTTGDRHTSYIESKHNVGKYNLGELLENGSPGGKLAPRPYADKIIQKTKDKAVEIYSRPYL